MFSAAQIVFAVVFALFIAAGIAISVSRRPVRPEKVVNWPLTEATIQSVGKVVVNAGRGSYSVNVGDFSYSVNNEYYSGRLTFTRPFSTGNGQTKDLINQKIQIRYDPKKPEKYSVLQAEHAGFHLDPYDEPFGKDVDPIDLGIDKIS